jgi:hypothetical protein
LPCRRSPRKFSVFKVSPRGEEVTEFALPPLNYSAFGSGSKAGLPSEQGGLPPHIYKFRIKMSLLREKAMFIEILGAIAAAIADTWSHEA